MIAVTGSSGFIGRALVAALAADGRTVVGLDRQPARHVDQAVPTIVSDLACPDARARRALGAADVVVHLAGRPGVRDHGPAAERQRRLDNVVAAGHVLAACRPDAFVVAASSSSVYGGSRGGRPCHEDDRVAPTGGYARSKHAGEVLCARRDGPTLVVRPFTVVGEGQRPDMALSRWITAAAAGRPLTVFGDLRRTRDLTDVADVVAALRAAIDRRPTGVVNVGTGTARSLGDIVDSVRRVVGDVAVETVAVPCAEPDDTLADPRRCVALLGVRPSTDLDDVVRRQHAAAVASVLDDVVAESLAGAGPRVGVPAA